MKVASTINRGDAANPWGIMRFDDGTPVAFRAGPDAWHVEHPSTEEPDTTTAARLKAALAHLNRHGVKTTDDATA